MRSAFEASHPEGDETQGPQRRRNARLILPVLTFLWALAVGAGLWVLWGYENAPGAGAEPPRLWPTDSRVRREPGRATLVILAHPRCPCSRASIGELASIIAQTQGNLSASVVFLKPAGFSDDWEKTELWQSAAGIPGVTAMVDEGGAEARLFGAKTSGQTLLYGADGRLLFSGGITGSRGHSGDNAGRDSVVSLVNVGAAERGETFTFGCPLFEEDSECRGAKHENHKQ
jgi:hypothetical protein